MSFIVPTKTQLKQAARLVEAQARRERELHRAVPAIASAEYRRRSSEMLKEREAIERDEFKMRLIGEDH